MIHTNILRHRLDRIELSSGLRLSEQDPPSLELSIKMFLVNQIGLWETQLQRGGSAIADT